MSPKSGAQPATVEAAAGDLIGGKFRVERVLGRGGMGVVLEATNVQLDQRVALKLMATGGDDPGWAERFAQEARAAARLRSEHVARVFDVDRDALRGPFIVMELLEGQTLASVLSTSGRVPMQRAVEYVIDACEGLAEAHARGIVHRDVKPGNLFLTRGEDARSTVKVLDFGIARVRSKEGGPNPKSSGPTVGTPAYLAPEQLRGSGAADHRADIWALGCVLYELLVGERAFRATRFTELVTKILEAPFHPFPPEVGVPAPVAAAVARCLERDPAKRFGSAGELALTLLPFARGRAHGTVAKAIAHGKSAGFDADLRMPSSMPPRPADDLPEPPSSAALAPPRLPDVGPGAETGRAKARGRRLVALAVAVSVSAALAAAVWMGARKSDAPRPSPLPPETAVTSVAPPLPAPDGGHVAATADASSEAAKEPPPSEPSPRRPAEVTPPRGTAPPPSTSRPGPSKEAPRVPDSEIRRTR